MKEEQPAGTPLGHILSAAARGLRWLFTPIRRLLYRGGNTPPDEGGGYRGGPTAPDQDDANSTETQPDSGARPAQGGRPSSGGGYQPGGNASSDS
jgi:hypothetical protein